MNAISLRKGDTMRHAQQQPIRNKIDLADPSQIRILRRRLGISADDLQRVVAKVGNSMRRSARKSNLKNRFRRPNRRRSRSNRPCHRKLEWPRRRLSAPVFFRVHRFTKLVSSTSVVRRRNEDDHPRLFSKPRFGDRHEKTYHLHRRSRTCLFFCRACQGMHQRCNRWGCRGFSRRSRQGRRCCRLRDRSPRSQQGGRGKCQSAGSDLFLKRRRQELSG
jgi:hypothetical protein